MLPFLFAAAMAAPSQLPESQSAILDQLAQALFKAVAENNIMRVQSLLPVERAALLHPVGLRGEPASHMV